MTTATASKPSKAAAKPKPARVASLTLSISGTDYRVRLWIPEDPDFTRAARLRKADGTAYNLGQRRDGSVSCDCPDGIYRREGTAELCRHAAALVAVGIFGPVPRFAEPTLEPLPRRSQVAAPRYKLKPPHVWLPRAGWIDIENMVDVRPDPREAGCVVARWGTGRTYRFRGDDALALPLAWAEYRASKGE